MEVPHIMLAVLAAAVTLTSVAAAGPEAAKQRMALTVTILPSGKGVLTPLKDGALKPDAGTFSGSNPPSTPPDRTMVRQGQTVEIYHNVWTFAGKGGSLVFRERTEAVDLGQDLDHNGFQDGIAIGTWKVVRGTGDYAGSPEVGAAPISIRAKGGSPVSRASSPSRKAAQARRNAGPAPDRPGAPARTGRRAARELG